MATEIARPIASGLLPDKVAEDTLAQFSTFTEGATVIINRMPTPQDRQILSARHKAVESALAAISTKGADFSEAKQLLAQFFLGYPSLLNADAPGLITAYLSDLRSLPLFAIRQALDDIKHGRITVSDGKGRQMPLDKDWPPSSTRVYDIAAKISDPKWREFLKLNEVLGSVQLARPEMTEAERDRVRVKIKTLHEEFSRKVQADLPQITANEEAEKRAAQRRERDKQEKENEYISVGLEPRYADEAKTIVISLSMLLALGHRIDRTDGKTRLLSPTLEHV